VAEAAAVGVKRKAHGGVDAIGQQGHRRVGRRIDAQARRGEQGLELGVARGLAQALAVDSPVVGDADRRALEHGAEPGAGAEEALGGVKDADEDAGAVEVAGHAGQGVEEVSHRRRRRGRAPGQGQRGAVGERGELHRVDA